MPWIVRLVAVYPFPPSSFRQMSCGGTILSTRFILTAAHCIRYRSRKAQAVTVVYNSTNKNQGPSAKVSDVIPHPRFNPDTVENDIAVLKLSERIRFDRFVKPVCLPMRRLHLTNRKAFAAGWGYTTDTGNSSELLRYIETKILPFKECPRSFLSWRQYDVFTSDEVVCTETDGKGVCQGDSGGPLTIWKKRRHRFVQVGLMSFSKNCSQKGYPNVHTRVSHFVPWIRQILWFRWWI